MTASSSFNKSKATAYAIKYADSPNRYKYGYLKKDCTNFASQIAVAGGMVPTNTWYCLPAPAANMYYSPTWCNANKFARYWPSRYNTVAHKNFSAYLKAGDFIAYDRTGDGSWNHIGYVTKKASSYNSKLGYTNYKVAQHTKNYHLWASSKDNGWDKLKSKYPNLKFGVIRIK